MQMEKCTNQYSQHDWQEQGCRYWASVCTEQNEDNIKEIEEHLNNLYMQYLNLGMQPAQAQMEAQKAIFGAEWERSKMQTEARQKAFGGILQGIGSVGAAAIGAPPSAGATLGGGLATAGMPAPLPVETGNAVRH